MLHLPRKIAVIAVVMLSTLYSGVADASIAPYQKPEALRDSYPLLSGAQKASQASLSAFPKWMNVMARYRGENIQAPCQGECKVAKWQQFLTSIQAKTLKEKVVMVNNYMNQQRYVRDSANWQTNDYWQTPVEFLEKGGDCEDYAIAKFVSLRQLGVPNSAMQVVVLNDERLRTIHAVLAINIDGESYILDNQIKKVVPLRMVSYYKPIYSVNEEQSRQYRT